MTGRTGRASPGYAAPARTRPRPTGPARMVTDYRIAKDKARVTLATADGEFLDGHVFVQPYVRHRTDREDPVDVFNAAEPFVPLDTPRGTVLYAKDHVWEVMVGPGDPPPDPGAGRTMRVRVTLAGGGVRGGLLRFDGTDFRPRLLDHLNALAARFLVLETDAGRLLINRARVTAVREHD